MARRPGRWWRIGAGGAALLLALAAASCSGDDDGGEGGGSAGGHDGGGGGAATADSDGDATAGADGTADTGAGQPDGEALVAAFDEAAEAAYAERGGDRERRFTEGIVLDDDCFALDGTGAAAIAEAAGLDPEGATALGAYLQGEPDENEVLTCAVAPGDREGRITVRAGTTAHDRDGYLDQVLRARPGEEMEEIEEIEGTAPGLDADHVLAVSQAGGETAAFAWVADGFQVSVAYPAEVADPDAGFAALSAAVAAVARTLA